MQPSDRPDALPRDPDTDELDGPDAGRGGWRATWVAGPAAGRATALTVGSHRVGRSTHAEVRSLDPAVAPFHGQLQVDADGTVAFVQLAGRAPSSRSAEWREGRIDGTADSDVATLTLAPHDIDGWIDIGASRLELRHDPHVRPQTCRPAATIGTGSRGTAVRRSPRALPFWTPRPIELPSAAEVAGVPFTGLVPTVLGMIGAVAVAAVMRQPMFLVFGVIGGLVALGNWGVQRWTAWRRQRAGRAGGRQAMQLFLTALTGQRADHGAHHRTFVGALEDAVADIDGLQVGLWVRRPDARDAFVVSAGRGEVRWEPHLAPHASMPDPCWTAIERAGVHRDASIPVDLGPGARVAVCGEERIAVVRSLLIQLAARTGPADWQLVVVSDDPSTWDWAGSLPHHVEPTQDAQRARVDGASARATVAFDEAGAAALCRDAERWQDRHTVIVTDAWPAMSVRTSAVRRLMGGDPPPAVIVMCPSVLDAPASCTAVLEAGRDGRGRWLPDVRVGSLPQPVRIAGLHERDARSLADRLGQLIDPEDPSHAAGAMPRSVSLMSLLSDADGPPTSASIAAAWRASPADAAPATPIGVAADGTVDVDLVRDGPHTLLAGTTGAGKSELLRALVLGLATRLSPEQLTFVLVDYKGGATFDSCVPLPHVVGIVTDLDDRLAERALRSLRAELHRRERILRRAGVSDLSALRREAEAPVLPRLLVLIDEFAALAVEHPSFLHSLVDIAQRGRSLGVHLLLATQRPSGVISDDIRANTNLRIALRLHDTADAIDVIGDASPAMLQRDVPGRAVMRLGPTELVEFQTGHVGARDGSGRTDAEQLVAAIVGASDTLAIEPPHRPWLEPLPTVLDPATIDTGDGSVGLLDVPDQQSQRPLRWRPETGHLLVVGARGAGVTSTLQTVARSAVERESEVYVIDALGDRAWEVLAEHPWCAGVVRMHERERLARLLRRLDPGTARQSRTLLVIDGLSALRAELDAVDRIEEGEALARILTAAGGEHPVAIAIGVADAASVPASIIARCPHRWLLHVNDRHDPSVLGFPGAGIPPDVPGRALVLGAAEDVAGPVEAQIVQPATSAWSPAAAGAAASRLDVLPPWIDAESLRSEAVGAMTASADEWRCPLGVAFDTLSTDVLTVPDGEHLLVLGPPRSGRSAVLVRVLRAWSGDARDHAMFDRWVGVLAPRRSPLRAHAEAITRVATQDGPPVVVHVAIDVAGLVASVPPTGPVLLVVDDAELVDDVDGRLGALVASRRPGLVVAAAGRPEGLRAAYGHWTGAVRRSRRGLLMTGCHEHDGDLLGVTLPRRGPISARPGLAHVVEDGGTRLVQCALDATPDDVVDPVVRRAARRADGARRATGLIAVS